MAEFRTWWIVWLGGVFATLGLGVAPLITDGGLEKGVGVTLVEKSTGTTSESTDPLDTDPVSVPQSEAHGHMEPNG